MDGFRLGGELGDGLGVGGWLGIVLGWGHLGLVLGWMVFGGGGLGDLGGA